jgi:hypothetical protein
MAETIRELHSITCNANLHGVLMGYFLKVEGF